MEFLAYILTLCIDIYIYIIIAHVLVHWLVAFDVINARSSQAQNLMRLLARLTDPVMRRVQKYVPSIGGIDISPIIVIIAGQILKSFIIQILVF